MSATRLSWRGWTAILSALGLGIGSALLWPYIHSNMLRQYADIYQSHDASLLDDSAQQPANAIGWGDLLPEGEEAVIRKYQPDANKPLHEQVFTSLQASFDDDYQATLHSVNSVPALDGQMVSIHGFIVPLELSDNRQVLSAFLVPYFGACIHFPAPAPNQMIYLRTPEGFSIESTQLAFKVTGLLRTAMFEDPQGTAAYVMDVTSINSYSGQPDDVRRHDANTY